MHESIHAGRLDDIDRAILDSLRDARGGTRASEILASLARQGHRISQPTLSRRLVRLEHQHHVSARRAGRSTVYRRDPFHDRFAQPPTQRPRVAYDPQLLEGYVPGVTRWLAPAELGRLHRAGGDRALDASTYSRAIAQKLLVDLSYASSALEGNTYSYLDTQVLVELGQVAEGKDAEETQMILNHKEAIQYLIENIAQIEISPRELRTLHALLSRGLIDPAAVGDVRRRPVDIGGSAYVPLAIPQKLTQELEQIARKAVAIPEPFEQSLFLMAFISYLQPFLDVNKRTGRLACNIPLLQNRLAPLSFLEMNKEKYVEGLLAFYELKRIDILKSAYVEAYVRSASRYDTYVATDVSALELEIRHRRDLYACVKAYVESSVQQGYRIHADVFAGDYFSTQPDELRSRLTQRAAQIIRALNDANHIGYGITRASFDAYKALAAPL